MVTKKTEEKREELHESAMQSLHGAVSVAAFRLSGDLLLVHQWGKKSVLEMLATMTGHPVPRLNKDLTQEGLDAAYTNLRGEDIIPCRVIKASFVNGASATQKAVSTSVFNRHVRVVGHSAPLKFESVDRCDVEMVKVGPWNDRRPDIRARTLYSNWSCDIVVQFPHSIIGKDKVATALRAAGMFVGLCEKRLEKGFELGGFDIKPLPQKDIDAIKARNSSPERKFEIPIELLRAASSQITSDDPRNPKRKMMSVAENIETAEERFAIDAEMGAPIENRIDISPAEMNGSAE